MRWRRQRRIFVAIVRGFSALKIFVIGITIFHIYGALQIVVAIFRGFGAPSRLPNRLHDLMSRAPLRRRIKRPPNLPDLRRDLSRYIFGALKIIQIVIAIFCGSALSTTSVLRIFSHIPKILRAIVDARITCISLALGIFRNNFALGIFSNSLALGIFRNNLDLEIFRMILALRITTGFSLGTFASAPSPVKFIVYLPRLRRP